MGGSGVAGTPSALVRFEQTVGIHFSLERRHEGCPGSLGRLARVVGRVEPVCTDPPAKGPTGPFCLVHSVMLPVVSGGSRRVLGSTASSPRSCPAGSAERSLDSPRLRFGPRLASPPA